MTIKVRKAYAQDAGTGPTRLGKPVNAISYQRNIHPNRAVPGISSRHTYVLFLPFAFWWDSERHFTK